jgi:acyl-CoA synthetase (AMP-forming)/AMP-acid ligase II
VTDHARAVVPDRTSRCAYWARVQPGKPALVEERDGQVHMMTYRELEDFSNRIANALRRCGSLPGERVGVMGRNSIELVALIQGAAKAGCGIVALNHRMQRTDAVDLLTFAQARLLFVEADSAPLFGDVVEDSAIRALVVFGDEARSGQVTLHEFLDGVDGTQAPPPMGGSDDGPMLAGFTSGTTGKPKRVMRDSKAGSSAETAHLTRLWGEDEHVFITSGSILSGAAGGYYSIALTRGDTVILQRKFDPEDWLRLAEKHKVTVAYFAPTNARQICGLPDEVRQRYDISSIRTVFAGAAKWSYALKLAYREAFPENSLWEIYGSTELGSNTVMEPHEHWGKPESCGRPVSGVEVILVDEAGGRVAEPYERGVVWVKSDFATGFLGYDGDPAATASAVSGEYRSVGDIGYFDEDGFFYICDRQKDMVVTGGVNVYPAEVEAVIDSYPEVLECAVFGIPDDIWGERVHAVVVQSDGAALEADEIIAYCRQHLASHKVPRGVDFADALPHTGSGKILKREIRDRYWAGAGRII